MNSKIVKMKVSGKEDSLEKILANSFIRNTQGHEIPLRNLIQISNIEKIEKITTGKHGEYLSYKNTSIEDIERQVNQLKKRFQHSSWNINFDGQFFLQKDLNKQLFYILLIALLLLYLIMVAQFESLLLPVIILLEIPIDIAGAFLLLYLFNESLNIMSGIGIVIMGGIVINDSILKIHSINQLLKKKISLIEAIKKGGENRFKAILMTSITTILALIPLFFMQGLGADLQKPLALTVIGGLTLGTFISLYFIPIIFYFIKKP